MSDGPRRRFLRTLGAALPVTTAGCWSNDDPDSPATRTTATRTSTPSNATITEPTESRTPDPLATVTWSRNLEGAIRVLQTGSDAIYAHTGANRIVALAPADGSVRWHHTPPGNLTEVDNAVLVTNSTTAPGRLQGSLEALDRSTGNHRWTFERREFLQPVGTVGDALYVAGHYITAAERNLGTSEDPYGEGRIHALDVETGEQRWAVSVPDLVEPFSTRRGSVPATVATHGLYVYEDPSDETGSEVTLGAFDLDGTERWAVATGTVSMDRPVPIRNGVFSGGDGDSVVLFTPEGRRKWAVEGWENGPSRVMVTDGGIFADGSAIGGISRYGELRWRASFSGRLVSPVEGEIVVVDGGDRVYGLDRWDGTPHWVHDSEEGASVLEVVPAGLIVVEGRSPWQEFALVGEEDGDVIGRVSTGAPFENTAVLGKHLFVGTDDGVRAFAVDT